MIAKRDANQTYFHRDDILSLDLSHDRRYAVTGQAGPSPSIHKWDTHTCESKAMFTLDAKARGV